MKNAIIFAILLFVCSCTQKQTVQDEDTPTLDTVMVQNENGEWKVASIDTTISDDSILTIRYWDTSLGGTSPDIAHEISFKDSKGITHEMPEDWGGMPAFTEIEDITSVEALYHEGNIYLVRTLTKNSSASMVRHLHALSIENDSLLAKPIFKVGDKLVSTIELQEVLH